MCLWAMYSSVNEWRLINIRKTVCHPSQLLSWGSAVKKGSGEMLVGWMNDFLFELMNVIAVSDS